MVSGIRVFEEIQNLVQSGNAERALAEMCNHLKAEVRFHELFDARLMHARVKHKLPVTLRGSLDELKEPLRSQIEEAYLGACREVGWSLLDNGQLRDAWMYL